MLDAIERIQRYAARGRAAFESDELLEAFILRNLQIVCEAAYQMPQETCASFPEIPWKDITGMRHILVHGYFEIRRDVAWTVVATDLPRLKPQLARMLDSLVRDAPPPS